MSKSSSHTVSVPKVERWFNTIKGRTTISWTGNFFNKKLRFNSQIKEQLKNRSFKNILFPHTEINIVQNSANSDKQNQQEIHKSSKDNNEKASLYELLYLKKHL